MAERDRRHWRLKAARKRAILPCSGEKESFRATPQITAEYRRKHTLKYGFELKRKRRRPEWVKAA